jgi:hypothetical protein
MHKNLRVLRNGNNPDYQDFVNFLLTLGDGKLENITCPEALSENLIQIPEKYCFKPTNESDPEGSYQCVLI